MRASDWIQVVIAAATFGAAVAAWVAANAARDSARDMRRVRAAELHERRLAYLQELLGIVGTLATAANFLTQQGERYAAGARLRSLIPLTGYELPVCEQIGAQLAAGATNVSGTLMAPAEAELRAAIGAEHAAIIRAIGPPPAVADRSTQQHDEAPGQP